MEPQDDAEAQQRRARQLVQRDGIFSRFMDTITGGVFLAGLGLYLGASNFTIGVLASLPMFAQVAQLPAVKLLSRIGNRKAVVVAATGIGRSILLVIAALLLVAPSSFSPTVLVVLIAAMAVCSVLAAAAWNWWMRDLITRSELGRYFGRRLQVTTLIGALALPVAGAALDRFVQQGAAHQGYALLFALGGLAGLISTSYLARTPHAPPRGFRPGGNAIRLITDQFALPETRRTALGLMLVGATLTTALPFTAVYLLRSVGYSYLTVTILSLVSHLAMVGSLGAWGHLSDRFGNRPVLQISIGMLVASLLGWSIAWGNQPEALFAFFVLLHFVSGFAVAGIDLTSSNLLLKTAPEANPPAYLAAVGLARALTAGLATLAAGAAWELMGAGVFIEIPVFAFDVWSLRGFHLLALAAVALGLLALLALRALPEEGVAPVVEVARAMRREVRSISSIAGIRIYVHAVSYLVEFFSRPSETGKTQEVPTAPNVVPREE